MDCRRSEQGTIINGEGRNSLETASIHQPSHLPSIQSQEDHPAVDPSKTQLNMFKKTQTMLKVPKFKCLNLNQLIKWKKKVDELCQPEALSDPPPLPPPYESGVRYIELSSGLEVDTTVDEQGFGDELNDIQINRDSRWIWIPTDRQLVDCSVTSIQAQQLVTRGGLLWSGVFMFNISESSNTSVVLTINSDGEPVSICISLAGQESFCLQGSEENQFSSLHDILVFLQSSSPRTTEGDLITVRYLLSLPSEIREKHALLQFDGAQAPCDGFFHQPGICVSEFFQEGLKPKSAAISNNFFLSPLFHNQMKNSTAEMLVTQGGDLWEGVCIVRASTSNRNYLVLTLNVSGKPMNMKVLIDAKGRASLEGYHDNQFDSVVSLLWFFSVTTLAPSCQADGRTITDMICYNASDRSVKFFPIAPEFEALVDFRCLHLFEKPILARKKDLSNQTGTHGTDSDRFLVSRLFHSSMTEAAAKRIVLLGGATWDGFFIIRRACTRQALVSMVINNKGIAENYVIHKKSSNYYFSTDYRHCFPSIGLLLLDLIQNGHIRPGDREPVKFVAPLVCRQSYDGCTVFLACLSKAVVQTASFDEIQLDRQTLPDVMEVYPWYRDISPEETNTLLLSKGIEWSGLFLVHQGPSQSLDKFMISANISGTVVSRQVFRTSKGEWNVEGNCNPHPYPTLCSLLENLANDGVLLSETKQKHQLTSYLGVGSVEWGEAQLEPYPLTMRPGSEAFGSSSSQTSSVELTSGGGPGLTLPPAQVQGIAHGRELPCVVSGTTITPTSTIRLVGLTVGGGQDSSNTSAGYAKVKQHSGNSQDRPGHSPGQTQHPALVGDHIDDQPKPLAPVSGAATVLQLNCAPACDVSVDSCTQLGRVLLDRNQTSKAGTTSSIKLGTDGGLGTSTSPAPAITNVRQNHKPTAPGVLPNVAPSTKPLRLQKQHPVIQTIPNEPGSNLRMNCAMRSSSDSETNSSCSQPLPSPELSLSASKINTPSLPTLPIAEVRPNPVLLPVPPPRKHVKDLSVSKSADPSTPQDSPIQPGFQDTVRPPPVNTSKLARMPLSPLDSSQRTRQLLMGLDASPKQHDRVNPPTSECSTGHGLPNTLSTGAERPPPESKSQCLDLVQTVDHKDPKSASDPLKEVSEYPWYHGDISASDAAKLVFSGQKSWMGTFLIRGGTSTDNRLRLTVNACDAVVHFRISYNDGAFFMQSPNQRGQFRSLPDLLEFYRRSSITSSPDGSPVLLTSYLMSINAVTRARDQIPKFGMNLVEVLSNEPTQLTTDQLLKQLVCGQKCSS